MASGSWLVTMPDEVEVAVEEEEEAAWPPSLRCRRISCSFSVRTRLLWASERKDRKLSRKESRGREPCRKELAKAWRHTQFRFQKSYQILFFVPSILECFLTSDSSSVLLPSICSLEKRASGDTCPAIPSVKKTEQF